MKATLYTLPSKQLLVYTDDAGKVVRVDHPLTEYGARAAAQDRGVPTIAFGDVAKLLGVDSARPKASRSL